VGLADVKHRDRARTVRRVARVVADRGHAFRPIFPTRRAPRSLREDRGLCRNTAARPPGAIVLTEHYLFPRLGLQHYWLEARGLALNKPALAAWIASIALAFILNLAGIHLFFLFVPVYVTAGCVYFFLARAAGAGRSVAPVRPVELAPARSEEIEVLARESESAANAQQAYGEAKTSPLTLLLGVGALASLIVCLWIPADVYRAGLSDFDTHLEGAKAALLVPTLIYFVVGTLFVNRWTASR
jgi:NCS1 family nucleobase:cation symporter-1